ncbi:type II toxin-antitoxin system VapC family toxin [soil metagenome]
MRVLLDTHVLLWALMEPDRLPLALRDALVDPGHHVMYSVVNIWEIAIKKSLGKPGFDFGPDEVLHAARQTGFVELPVTGEHAARVLTLEPLHQDPFDRLLIAQALCEPARLLTADRAVSRYAAPIDLMVPQ